MQKVLYSFIIAFAILTISANAQSKDAAFKIGIVAVETIVKELPEAQVAEKRLNELTTKIQDTLVQKQKALEEKFAAYQKQKAMMPQDQQSKTEQELQAQNQDLMQYRQVKQQELQKTNQDVVEPLRAKVLAAIKEVANAEKITLVLEKNNPTILYVEDKYDITYVVLDKLKRGK